MNSICKVFALTSITLAVICAASTAGAAAFIKFDGVDGEATGPDGASDWFVADSFSFGVEREMKESGEKGGTEDINIGVGELQECTISKSMDATSPQLAQFAVSGNSLGACEVCLADAPGSALPVCYAHFVMERCYVRSFATRAAGDEPPTEEVAFYYNKIAFSYVGAPLAKSLNWDDRRKQPWPDGLTWLFDFGDR